MPDETKTYSRTEDGITIRVTAQEALAEARAAMTDRVTDRAHVRIISRDSGRYDITYTDDRHVVLALVDEGQRSCRAASASASTVTRTDTTASPFPARGCRR
ncbi:hypothetical protein [Streptomyces sp. NPDC007088]|uniref:hypothetical protein n=1 Tax=Streptomyces sp. NPDC007088 TaxID=3364773 RepID=UPI003675749E